MSANMEIGLGKPVIGSDGKKVGTVDRLVIDADTQEIRQIIVQQGSFLSKDRIVDRPLIERVDQDGALHLNTDSGMVDQLPEFFEAQYIIPRQEDQLRWMPQAWTNSSGVGAPILFAPGGEIGHGYNAERGYDRDASFMEPAPVTPPLTETESNLRSDTVMIDKGTDVVDKGGDKIGTVDEIIYDADGNVEGFVVKEGFIFHHNVRVPADWVESMTPDAVKLRVSADEADQSSQG